MPEKVIRKYRNAKKSEPMLHKGGKNSPLKMRVFCWKTWETADGFDCQGIIHLVSDAQLYLLQAWSPCQIPGNQGLNPG